MRPAATLRRDLRTRRITLARGVETTVHVAVYPRALVAATVVALPAPEPLRDWCARAGVQDALVGGFFVTPGGPALGEVWVEGGRDPHLVALDVQARARRGEALVERRARACTSRATR